MNNVVLVNKEEHRKIHMRENYITAEEERKDKALKALRTIQDICNEQIENCINCPFADRDRTCLIGQIIPDDWEIGEFENGKLLR